MNSLTLMFPVKKDARLAHPIHALMAQRWSPRSFLPGKDLSTAQVQQLFEAARWTPSSYNLQPWRYLYAHLGEEGFDRLLSLLHPGNRPRARHASLLILSLAETRVEGRDAPNSKAFYDMGAANFALTLQAQDLGLYVHQMGGFDTNKARAQFDLPEGLEPAVMLAVGYLDQAESEDGVPRKERLRQESFARPV